MVLDLERNQENNKATVVGLSGNLGAGKTTFVKALLKSLGVEQNVVSPTFVLRRDYCVVTGLTPDPSPLERGAMQRVRTSDFKNYDSLKLKALEMRQNPTQAEKKLWQYLRSNNFEIRFRRQHVIDNFIVDFVNLESKVVIEVDGEVHKVQKERDIERDAVLKSLGYNVLRFTNNQVITDINFVLSEIKKVLVPLSNGEGLGVRRIKNIIHIDAYRLETHSQIYQVITKEELADKNNLILVEWPELSENIFQKIFLFEHVDEDTRKISVK
jgi:very-short-patch-repair endonuclease/tRNA A37 threonylcarbamoyladenosine biosynthesis protein TsaE